MEDTKAGFPGARSTLCVPSPLTPAEGDRKAYQENAQYSIEQNKEKIAKLRSENKQLRVKLANRMKVS